LENPPLEDRPRRGRTWVVIGLLVSLGLMLAGSSPRPAETVLAAPAAIAPSPGASAPGVSPLRSHASRRPTHRRATKRPTIAAARPTHRSATKRPRTPVSTCGAPRNPYHLNLCGHGHPVTAPPSDVCDYLNCVDLFWTGHGYLVRCDDGRYGLTGGRLGSCAWHGGKGRPVYRG
jgi:hypothetical protein